MFSAHNSHSFSCATPLTDYSSPTNRISAAIRRKKLDLLLKDERNENFYGNSSQIAGITTTKVVFMEETVLLPLKMKST